MNADMARAEDERAARDWAIARDEYYANAVNAAAALLRIDVATERERVVRTGAEPHPARLFSTLLMRVAASIRHGESGDPILALFEDHRADAVCRALLRAVSEPQPEEP